MQTILIFTVFSFLAFQAPVAVPDAKVRAFFGHRRTTMSTLLKVALVLLLCPVCCMPQLAAAYGGSLTLTVENDTWTGSDNNYTNGVGISWVSDDLDIYDDKSFVRKWGRFWAFLPFVSDDGYTTYAAWSLVQEMHTPDDIEDPNPPEDDQPYAGVLYVDNLLYARRERWAHAWELKLGVVGPASGAEDTQKWFHDLIGSDEPQGWDTERTGHQPWLHGRVLGGRRQRCGTGRVENRSCGDRRAWNVLYRCRTRCLRRSWLEFDGCFWRSLTAHGS